MVKALRRLAPPSAVFSLRAVALDRAAARPGGADRAVGCLAGRRRGALVSRAPAAAGEVEPRRLLRVADGARTPCCGCCEIRPVRRLPGAATGDCPGGADAARGLAGSAALAERQQSGAGAARAPGSAQGEDLHRPLRLARLRAASRFTRRRRAAQRGKAEALVVRFAAVVGAHAQRVARRRLDGACLRARRRTDGRRQRRADGRRQRRTDGRQRGARVQPAAPSRPATEATPAARPAPQQRPAGATGAGAANRANTPATRSGRTTNIDNRRTNVNIDRSRDVNIQRNTAVRARTRLHEAPRTRMAAAATTRTTATPITATWGPASASGSIRSVRSSRPWPRPRSS